MFSLSQFSHRVSVFATPFIAAGAFAVEQAIRNGTLTTSDYKGIGLAFATGAVIAFLNYSRATVAPTPPAVTSVTPPSV